MIKILRATIFALVSSVAVMGANAASVTKEDAQAFKDGQFHSELHVFVYDLDGKLIAPPINTVDDTALLL